GGIMVLGPSTARIRANVIRDNVVASGNGGGVSLFGASGIVIERNTIAGNRADGGIPCAQGGAIWIVNDANLTIAGNLITRNAAGCGAGIYAAIPSSTLLIVNNTIAFIDGPQGSAVYNAGFAPGSQLVNNILIGAPGQPAVGCSVGFDLTSSQFRLNDAFSASGPAYTGVCQDATGVNGNMSADPMFVDAAHGNYRIPAGSPAVDAGDKSAAGIPSIDLDGAVRLVDGDGDGIADVDL